MRLSPGTVLGVYEVTGLLGAGGMGEVYRARDTRLKRDVAIKVLPDAFAQDREHLARFQREAELLATLTHPNIATVFGIEDGDGVVAIVMELVEGAPLAGPVPLERALIYASQMCSALEAAHKKGIIHRDLKPANILITKTGVKLLDFGLAKQRSGGSGGNDADADAGTDAQVTKMLTGAHVVVGTPQYMAPEQIEGHVVDARTDIFALGCVLYELLTGQKAFDGKTPSSVMAAILATEPRPLKDLQPLTPASLERTIKRCLAKDPDERWQTARDLRAELEWIGASSAASSERAAAPTRGSATRRILPWVIAAASAVGAAVVLWLAMNQPIPAAPPITTSIAAPNESTFELLYSTVPVLSPDGRWIVFAARTKDNAVPLWVRRLDSPSAQMLPGTNRALQPFWSPDSRFVAFADGAALKKIDIAGGAPVTITELPTAFRGGTWSRDGVILFGLADVSPIRRISATGGEMTMVSTLDPSVDFNGHRFPFFLPDGKHFLYSSASPDDVQIRLGSLDTPAATGQVVVHASSSVVFSQGKLLFLRGGTLMAQAFSLQTFTVSGDVTPIAEGIPTVFITSRVGAFTASANGMLAYYSTPASNSPTSMLAWVDRAGKFLAQVGEPVWQIGNIDISPNGHFAAVAVTDGRDQEDIFIYELERGVPTRFTSFQGQDRNPTWAPDGQTLFWSSPRKGAPDIYRKAVSGPGDDLLVYSDTKPKIPNTVSPDGHTLLFNSLGPLYVLSLDGSGAGAPTVTPFLTPVPPAAAQRAVFSPDGQWVAFAQDDSGRNEIFVAPFPGPGRPRRITSIGASYPRWRRDGKELFYVTVGGELRSVDVAVSAAEVKILGRDRLLFGGIVVGRGHLYDVTSDGQKFLIARESGSTTSALPLTLVQNWTTLLKR